MLPGPAGDDAVVLTDTVSDLEPLFADDDVNNGAFVRTVARTAACARRSSPARLARVACRGTHVPTCAPSPR